MGRPLVLLKVYPRVGGGNTVPADAIVIVTGLSPRGRGKRLPGHPQLVTDGSIPAWAGETEALAEAKSKYEVYPRVGGGNAHKEGIERYGRGLSPRGRGKPR